MERGVGDALADLAGQLFDVALALREHVATAAARAIVSEKSTERWVPGRASFERHGATVATEARDRPAGLRLQG